MISVAASAAKKRHIIINIEYPLEVILSYLQLKRNNKNVISVLYLSITRYLYRKNSDIDRQLHLKTLLFDSQRAVINLLSSSESL